eukprot:g7011.t1
MDPHARRKDFDRRRAVELKHGRICMFATIGMLWPDVLMPQGRNGPVFWACLRPWTPTNRPEEVRGRAFWAGRHQQGAFGGLVAGPFGRWAH